jgi:hypothetical protein
MSNATGQAAITWIVVAVITRLERSFDAVVAHWIDTYPSLAVIAHQSGCVTASLTILFRRVRTIAIRVTDILRAGIAVDRHVARVHLCETRLSNIVRHTDWSVTVACNVYAIELSIGTRKMAIILTAIQVVTVFAVITGFRIVDAGIAASFPPALS